MLISRSNLVKTDILNGYKKPTLLGSIFSRSIGRRGSSGMDVTSFLLNPSSVVGFGNPIAIGASASACIHDL